jgi:hypothetical protein
MKCRPRFFYTASCVLSAAGKIHTVFVLLKQGSLSTWRLSAGVKERGGNNGVRCARPVVLQASANQVRGLTKRRFSK